jgi:glycosyltransferase involved in cell wall biosynthesis
MKVKKICFFLPTLKIGGAERFVVNLILEINKLKKLDIRVLTINKNGELKKILENNKIKIFNCNKSRLIFSLREIFSFFKKEKPDIIFSTVTYANVAIIFLAKFLIFKPKIIIRESNYVTKKYGEFKKLKDFFINYLIKKLYRHSDLVIALTHGLKKDLNQNYNIPNNKIIVINNFFNFNLIKKLSFKKNSFIKGKNKKYLLYVGRLDKQKNLISLLKTFKNFKLFNSFYLIFIGRGEEKEKIINFVKNNRIKNFKLFNFKSNPYPYMREADMCILNSSYEGFPNFLIEASYLCKKVVARNCYGGGSKEIISKISHGKLYPLNSNQHQVAQVVKEFSSRKIKKNTKLLEKNFSKEKLLKSYIKAIGI